MTGASLLRIIIKHTRHAYEAVVSFKIELKYKLITEHWIKSAQVGVRIH